MILKNTQNICFFVLIIVVYSMRAEECHSKSEAPVLSAARLVGAQVSSHLELFWHPSDFQKLCGHQVNGHCPLFSLPVIGGFRV